MTTKSRSKPALAATPIKCDRCGRVDVCLFTYEDPNEDYLAMLFCSLDCLTVYVRMSKTAFEVLSRGEVGSVTN